VTTGGITIGGLVGLNDWTIQNSSSAATVSISATAGADQFVGGLAGANSQAISNSYATGSVSSNGGDVFIGGLVGSNEGTITSSHAIGNVTAANASTLAVAGGLVGGNSGAVDHAYATGNVSVSGDTGIAGGFVGINSGYLNQVFSTGSVTGTATNNFLGGFVGVNADTDSETPNGQIIQAYATGAVTGTANSVIGGFAAINTGWLDQTYAIGKLTGGALTGGLVASNTSAPLGSTLDDYNISLSGVGIATNSYWDPATTGTNTTAPGNGVARSTQNFLTSLPPGFAPAVWGLQPNPSYPHFAWQPNNTIPITNEPVLPNIPSQQQIIDNLVSTVTFASLNTSPVVTTQNNGARQPQFPPPQPPGGQPPPGQPPQDRSRGCSTFRRSLKPASFRTRWCCKSSRTSPSRGSRRRCASSACR
jgi:hypothetical protein